MEIDTLTHTYKGNVAFDIVLSLIGVGIRF